MSLLYKLLNERVDPGGLLLLHPVADSLQQLQAVILHPGRRALGGAHRDCGVRSSEDVKCPEITRVEKSDQEAH